MTTNRELAEQRAALFWQRYRENGKLLLADIKELTDGKVPAEIVKTFKRHDIAIPPIYDSFEEKRKRRCAEAWQLVSKKDREWLTTRELAELWGCEVKHALNLYRNMQKYGLVLPEIRYKSRQRKHVPPPPPDTRMGHTRYPAGFTYWKKTPLPNGMARYHIK